MRCIASCTGVLISEINLKIKTLKKIFSYTAPLVLGLLAVWLVFRGQDLHKIAQSFEQINYFWVAGAAVVSLLGHLSRAVRWRMLLRPLGYTPSVASAFWAVMINYIANLALPRMGEVSRCAAVLRTDAVPMPVSLGTVVTDRLVDMCSFLLVFVLALAFNFGFFRQPLQNLVGKAAGLGVLAGLGVVVLAGLVLGYFYYQKHKDKILQNKLMASINKFFVGLWSGLASIKKVRSPLNFLVHSFAIWFSYLLCMYCMLMAFGVTSMLTLNDALILLTMGSLGFIVPVQGGIGAYHAVVSWSLVQLGVYYATAQPQLHFSIDTAQALAFATVAHAILTLVSVVAGLAGLGVVFLKKAA